MLKNALALIGLYVVSKSAYNCFQKHIKAPVERAVTAALDDEAATKPAAATPAE